jgi:hypothetical protein
MQIEINNIDQLINFVENNKASLQAKIKVIEKCLNVFFVEPETATTEKVATTLKDWQSKYLQTKGETPFFFDLKIDVI